LEIRSTSPGAALDPLGPQRYDTPHRSVREAAVAASIEILYLRFPVHPNITVIQIGPGIQRIDKEGDSYFVVGTEDGPLAGKKVEIPGDNVAAIQWTLDEPAIKTS
jgi:hypothetical protein